MLIYVVLKYMNENIPLALTQQYYKTYIKKQIHYLGELKYKENIIIAVIFHHTRTKSVAFSTDRLEPWKYMFCFNDQSSCISAIVLIIIHHFYSLNGPRQAKSVHKCGLDTGFFFLYHGSLQLTEN